MTMDALESAHEPVLSGEGAGGHPIVVHGALARIEAESPVLAPTRPGGPEGAGAVVKRMVDLAVALTLLLAVLPVFVVVAIGVRVSSPGPVFFRQARLGRGGRAFTMYKFRTFPVDHEDRTVSLPTSECPLAFGRFLRRTSLDELPQLLNVALGHMSLVGPRPERPRFAVELARSVPAYVDRLRAPAGITGLAQVRGLYGLTSLHDRVAADNEYIERWSVWSDLGILVRTIPAVVRKAR